METRYDMIKSLAQEKLHDFSYSAVLRHLRKNNPELVSDFLKAFKEAFDEGMRDDLDDIEQAALMEAIQSIGIELS